METLDVNDAISFDPVRPTSKVLVDSPKVRLILFCLEEGQEIPAHGADAEVIFYTVQGTGVATVGEEEVPIRDRVIVRCPPQVQHGLKARESLVVLASISPRPW